MNDERRYQQPMDPWDELEPFGKEITLDKPEINLFYYETGKLSKPVILLIHGLGDEADTWRHVIKPLANNFHVIAPDLPGFGRSEKPTRDYTPEFHQSALTGLMDQLDIESAILMGSSLGAILAQSLALFDDRIMGLILVGGSLLHEKPIKDIGLRLMQIPLLGEWLYTRLRKDPDAAFDSLRNMYQDLDSLPEKDRDFLYTRVNKRVWSDGQRRAYFSTLRNLYSWVREKQQGLKEKLSNFEIPTYVLRGEHDSLYPEENARALIQTQPSAEMMNVQGAGHLPHQENPEEFLEAVGEWINKNF